MPPPSPWDDLRDRVRAERDRVHHLERAKDDLETSGSCTECGRPIGDKGRWYSDTTGSLVPYCKACAEIEFPVL